MNQFGKIIGPGTIRFERLLPGSVEVVWTYLTESEKRGKWLASGEMELFEGGKIELNFVHADLSAVKEVIPSKYKDYEKGHGFTGRVTKCDPPNLLSFTWADNSEVTFKLIQRGAQVLLERLQDACLSMALPSRRQVAGHTLDTCRAQRGPTSSQERRERQRPTGTARNARPARTPYSPSEVAVSDTPVRTRCWPGWETEASSRPNPRR